MSVETAYDFELGERLHDAYDAMGPDAAAQERVLHALKSRQEASAPGASHGTVVPMRRTYWRVVLPLAACLVLAVVVARAVLPGRDAAPLADSASAVEKPANGVFDDEAAAQESTAVVVPDEDAEVDAFEPIVDADAVPVATSADAAPTDDAVPVAVYPADETGLHEAYPLVTLASGETLRVGEAYEGTVDERCSVAAIAAADGSAESVCCEVVQEGDAFYVRYEDDFTWYTATIAD